jgi:hypothetical protein
MLQSLMQQGRTRDLHRERRGDPGDRLLETPPESILRTVLSLVPKMLAILFLKTECRRVFRACSATRQIRCDLDGNGGKSLCSMRARLARSLKPKASRLEHTAMILRAGARRLVEELIWHLHLNVMCAHIRPPWACTQSQSWITSSAPFSAGLLVMNPAKGCRAFSCPAPVQSGLGCEEFC